MLTARITGCSRLAGSAALRCPNCAPSTSISSTQRALVGWRQSARRFSQKTVTNEKKKIVAEWTKPKESVQSGKPSEASSDGFGRRRIMVALYLIAVWSGTHAYLLYKRRSTYRSLEVSRPPIGWDEFKRLYLDSAEQKVHSVINMPQHERVHVYFEMDEATKRREWWERRDGLSRDPDVRIHLKASDEELKALFAKHVSSLDNVYSDEFPNYREFFVIVAYVGVAALLVKDSL